MWLIKEFRDFAMKGNVLDLAVWVIIWTAFGKIVSSLVADVIMPIIWVILWWIDFSKLSYVTTNLKWEEVAIKYGLFLQNVFDFIIIAFSIFLFIKLINKAKDKAFKKKEKEEAKEEKQREEAVVLLEEIRDLMKWLKKNTK